MDAGMDTGPILLSQKVPIEDSETASALSFRLSQIGADLLVETIKQIKAERLHPVLQGDEGASLAPLLKKEEGFVRWNESATAILNRWRGVFGWPGTTAFYNDEIWKVTALEMGEREGAWGESGEMLRVSEQGLDVAAGVGYIRIVRLRLPGGKEMTPLEYAAGHSLHFGVSFRKKEK
jgi:methionyl-tRNA formyltransferase